jgi:hypothetical protein
LERAVAGDAEERGDAMRMLLAVAMSALVAAFAAGTAGAVGFDPEPLPCADITGLEGFYDQEVAFAFVIVGLAEPACREIVYAVFVYADAGDTAPIGGAAVRGYGSDLLNLAFPVAAEADDDGVVHVCAVSYRRKRGEELIHDVFGYPNAASNNFACFGVAVEDEDN